MSSITQITHHDLDGYGASTVVGAFAEVDRVLHVARYSDVGPVVSAELKRLRRAAEPELLLLTDIGLEAGTVSFIKQFATMNAQRTEARHRLLVLDHHLSSVEQLAAQGIVPAATDSTSTLKRFTFEDPELTVIVDEARCATKLAFDHRDLYATGAVEPSPALSRLVEAIDAVDLWQKQRPIFRQALVLDELFWESVSGFLPLEHPWHDRFMSALLLAAALLLADNLPPAEMERRLGTVRADVLDALLRGQPGDEPTLTARMRIAPVLARAPELFHRFESGAKMSFALDAGTFQRVSDAILSSLDATLVINVQRSGSMSFRSTDGSALDAARKFKGGGHADAAGGRLASGMATSLSDAAEQVKAVLEPPPPDLSKSPFAALQGFKA